MTKQEYVKQVAKNLKCSSKKKSEIVRQLESDIEIALGEKRELAQVLAEMGKPEALAGEFNENLGEDEVKKSGGRRWLIVIAVILAVLAAIAGIVYWILPKTVDISDSKIFDETQVRLRSEEIIRLFDAHDYETLYGYMDDELLALLDETTLDEIRTLVNGDWGAFHAIGNVYMTAITQLGKECAVVQVNVSYDNVGVTYTLCYNEDMQLNGFYIK